MNDLQLLPFANGRLLNQPYENEAKHILKMLLASSTFRRVLKKFRCLNDENFGSVGQRVSKLLAVKL